MRKKRQLRPAHELRVPGYRVELRKKQRLGCADRGWWSESDSIFFPCPVCGHTGAHMYGRPCDICALERRIELLVSWVGMPTTWKGLT